MLLEAVQKPHHVPRSRVGNHAVRILHVGLSLTCKPTTGDRVFTACFPARQGSSSSEILCSAGGLHGPAGTAGASQFQHNLGEWGSRHLVQA